MAVKLDWLAFTIPYSQESFDHLEALFGERRVNERGFSGYSQSAATDGGALIGWADNNQKNGIHVVLSSGALGIYNYLGARNIIKYVYSIRGWATRIDLAWDDRTGFLNLDVLHEKLIQGHLVSRFRKYERVQKWGNSLDPVEAIVARSEMAIKKRRVETDFERELVAEIQFLSSRLLKSHEERRQLLGHIDEKGYGYPDELPDMDRQFARIRSLSRIGADLLGDTIYIGNRSSDSFFRAYDKTAEQRDPSLGHWIRAEFEFKGDRAKGLGRQIAEDRDNLAATANYYLMFKEPTFREKGDKTQLKKRISDWNNSDWWVDLIESESRNGRIDLPDRPKNIETVRSWLYEQVAGGVRLLYEVGGAEEIEGLMSEGLERIGRNKTYQQILAEETMRRELIFDGIERANKLSGVTHRPELRRDILTERIG